MHTLTYHERRKARGMLADKQGVTSIAEELDCEAWEVQELADAKPKPALSNFMFFCQENRELAQKESGTTDTKTISKWLGDKWAQCEDRTPYEELSASDKARFERENTAYLRALDEEEAEYKAELDAAAAGPSEREVERAEKRARMEAEAAARAEKPKAPKKARVQTEDEKRLEEQNKAIMGDKDKSAKQRLAFLLGQSDLFKHFGLQEEGTGKKKKKGRKSEKEEDEEMMGAVEGGGGGDSFEEKIRVTKQPDLINSAFGNLRPYQVAGLNWLANLYQNGINGILADEMGLGKTLQCISLLCWLREVKQFDAPYLVLAPKSTLTNWVREFKNWAPIFKVCHFHGDKDERARLIEEQLQPGFFDVCITSYEMVIREQPAFRKFAWRYIIVDEAHRMKNEESKLSQTLRSFDSHSRLLITGTPMQNNLHELWALLNFLLPDIFSSADQFNEWFDVSDKKVEAEVIGQLHKVLRPFLLRRVKKDVESSIPSKKELIVYTQLSAMQREQYKNILKRDMDALYQSSGSALTQNKSRLLNLVMQLRKCCNHPYLFEGVEDKSLDPFGDHLVTNCGKMMVLDKLLLRLKKENSRVLIFSQMTRVLDLLEDYAVSRQRRGDDFRYCRIDGSTGGADRQDMIDAFNGKDMQGSDIFLFLLSTRAGGLGINLQTADCVVIYDSDWNPQADLQAMDRAHRIGQTKDVKVFRFVTGDSIEEKVIERAELKLQMDSAIIQAGRLAEKHKNLSKEEALAAVRYGADKVFRAENAEITDAEIETMIANAKDLTAEREEKLKGVEDKAKRDLLDFSDANVNFQEFDGVDYSAMRASAGGDMEFMAMMQDSMGKRERSGTSYNERDFYRGSAGPSAPVDKSLPKMKKVPDMKDFQLFNVKRIYELYEKEHAAETRRAKAIQRAAEAGASEPTEAIQPSEQELADAEELKQLEAQGFTEWTRNEFNKFTKACEKHGREQLKDVAEEVGTKTLEEVRVYSEAFWVKGAEYIAEFDKISRRIEEGERKIAEKKKMADALEAKVKSCENPWQTLSIKYGNNRGKLFTEDEDRFLVCMTYELGYGKWEELKREVRRCPDFRFDWLFKSRTPIELGRRVDLLIRLIQNENKEPGQRKRKDSAGAAAAQDGAVPMEE